MNPVPVAATMVMAVIAVMFGSSVPTPASGAPAEGVINGVAHLDTAGWSAATADGAIKVERVTGLTGAPHTTGVRLRRDGGATEWAHALVELRNPFFVAGQTYRMSAWVRDLNGAANTYGVLLANHAYKNGPTAVSEYAKSSGTTWRQIGRTFVAGSTGAADTAFYLALPTTGSFDVQVTGVSVQRVAAFLPAKVTTGPTRTVTFPGRAGSPIDPAVWNHETGGGGWGNGELQTYTNSVENSYVDGNGNLKITAYRTGSGFTSARISTQNKVVVQPGSYVEASIVAPVGAAVWPAFWMIGTNIDDVGWPACGELDIFEGTGSTPTKAHAAAHMGTTADPKTDKSYGWGDAGGTTDIGSSVEAAPHRYGVYFDDRIVRFYLDGKPTMTVWAPDAQLSGRSWPFGKAHYLVLNVAVDGTTDNSATVFPRTMTVGPISIWQGGVPF